MRTAAATQAALALAIALTAVGCSSAGSTEDNPGADKSPIAAATSPTPSSTPSQSKSDGKTVTMPDLIKVTQTSEIPAGLSDRLDDATAQFSSKDHSLTLVPAGPNEAESGNLKFAVDADLPENCTDLKPKSEALCADIFLFGVTRSDMSGEEHVMPRLAHFMSLKEDVGQSLITVNIPSGDATKFFASVMIADKVSTINVATGKTTDEFGPILGK